MNTTQKQVDQNAIKFNQISIVVLVLAGFIIDNPYLPLIVSVVLLAGTLSPYLALFKQIYKELLLPLGLMKQNVIEDSPEPHNFAQLLGGIFLAMSGLFLFNGAIIAGWIFAWIVILLALANIIFGFCAGCFIYFQLGKLGFPGFHVEQVKAE